MDEETGDFLNHNLAGYHVATNADVRSVDVSWLDEPDDVHPAGVKGLGEVGIVGTAAAIPTPSGTPPASGTGTCRSPRQARCGGSPRPHA
jgi:hypothetical protein